MQVQRLIRKGHLDVFVIDGTSEPYEEAKQVENYRFISWRASVDGSDVVREVYLRWRAPTRWGATSSPGRHLSLRPLEHRWRIHTQFPRIRSARSTTAAIKSVPSRRAASLWFASMVTTVA